MDISGEERIPKVFVSYSHDSPSHKQWVAELSSKLIKNGIDVILDQWDLGLGDDVPKFMENSVTLADRVLMICTEPYVRKADEGKGGVGYEAMIVTGELIRDLGTSKFIPVTRQTIDQPSLPKSVCTRFYVNLSDVRIPLIPPPASEGSRHAVPIQVARVFRLIPPPLDGA